MRLCSQMPDPPKCLHSLLLRLCSQKLDPTHSLQCFVIPAARRAAFLAPVYCLLASVYYWGGTTQPTSPFLPLKTASLRSVRGSGYCSAQQGTVLLSRDLFCSAGYCSTTASTRSFFSLSLGCCTLASSSSASLRIVRGSGYCSARGVVPASSTEGPRKRKPPPP